MEVMRKSGEKFVIFLDGCDGVDISELLEEMVDLSNSKTTILVTSRHPDPISTLPKKMVNLEKSYSA